MSAMRVASHHRSRVEVAGLLRDYAASGRGRREFCLSRRVGVGTVSCYLKRARAESVVAVELSSAKPAEQLRIGAAVAWRWRAWRGGQRIDVQGGSDFGSVGAGLLRDGAGLTRVRIWSRNENLPGGVCSGNVQRV